MKIQDMHPSLRPREKALEVGVERLSDRELLALFIRTGTKKKSALQIADEILEHCGALNNFASMSLSSLVKISGIKQAKAVELLGVVEMARRLVKPPTDEVVAINNPSKLVEWLNLELGFSQQEQFMVVCLNTQNKMLGSKILFKGTVDRSVVHPRDVIREATLLNASRIILVHNHPGGSMEASSADLEVTERIVAGGRVVGIDVCDHIIVSKGRYFSLKYHYPYMFEE